jgi:hypothetical protein
MNCSGAQKEILRINQSPQAYNYPLKCRGVIYESKNMIIDNQINTTADCESKLLIG